jgi:transcriptional regulator with XRE-family HTH domain
VALGEQAKMSQAVFAKVLYVSAKTVQSWEQGKRVPSQASRRRNQIFAEQPAVVCKVLRLQGVELRGFNIGAGWKGKADRATGDSDLGEKHKTIRPRVWFAR